jgi:hypothetical protein
VLITEASACAPESASSGTPTACPALPSPTQLEAATPRSALSFRSHTYVPAHSVDCMCTVCEHMRSRACVCAYSAAYGMLYATTLYAAET